MKGLIVASFCSVMLLQLSEGRANAKKEPLNRQLVILPLIVPKALPPPTSGGPCPPPNPLGQPKRETTLVIPITDTTGCYELTSPDFPANYPNASTNGQKASYVCKYEFQFPNPPDSIRFSLKTEDFEMQMPTSGGKCHADYLNIRNIVEDPLAPFIDDKETFVKQVKFCGTLTNDYDFEVNPGKDENRFQVFFKANKDRSGKGFKGLLCFP
eukprot:maker-scaffold251_size238241-snap-gene-1.19 protein:Tk10377 transcript:maker-scaffold251_size238241-snap-gene-1.19-mRNA-1 annotation:"hypothetical protein CAPTEDRAFT_189092"